jgi:DNA gyrase inhibitor GyrI
VSYRWLKNGEVISGGANGTLTVSWRKPNNAPTDTYRAIACYTLTDGQTAESAASSGLSIENMPAGLIIAIQ